MSRAAPGCPTDESRSELASVPLPNWTCSRNTNLLALVHVAGDTATQLADVLFPIHCSLVIHTIPRPVLARLSATLVVCEPTSRLRPLARRLAKRCIAGSLKSAP